MSLDDATSPWCELEPAPGRGQTTESYLDLPGAEAELLSFRYVRRWLDSVPVLDLGCSKGSYLAQCGEGSIGVDVSRPNLEFCRQKGLQVISADLNRELPFPSGTVSAILCSHLLEHVDAPIHLLRECQRVLTDDGLFVLGLPVESSLVNWIRGENYFRDHPGHLYSFSLQNIKVLIAKTGFRTLRFFFEPRVVRFEPWLTLMQHLHSGFVYPLSMAFWVVARKGSAHTRKSDHHS